MTRTKLYYLILLIILTFSIFYVVLYSGLKIEDFECSLRGCGFYAPLLFILITSLAPVFFIPITPFSISAGILFGPLWGTVVALLGATIGGGNAFIVSRYLMKEWVDTKTPARVAIVKEKIQQDGWKFIAISRITPIIPFNVQNYLFGVSDVSFKTFMISSLLSLIPGSFLFAYLGHAGKSVFEGDPNAKIKILITIIVFVFIIFVPKIVDYLKSERKKLNL